MNRSTALLLIGYNRPDLALRALTELASLREMQVLVSVDGAKTKEVTISDEWMALARSFSEANWVFRDTNLGIAQHVFLAISEALQEFDNCIVVEDDVRADTQMLLEMKKLLDKRLPSSILTVGLFGGLPALPILSSFLRNRWRKTPYFSSWCWGIQSEDWEGFSLEIARNYASNLDDLITKRIGRKKIPIWKRRFNNVIQRPEFTWDYQLFLYSMVLNKKHILPTFRTCENIGFNDARATNTKNRKPSWYRGRKATRVVSESLRRQNSFLSKLLQWIDSLTWVGDQPLLQKVREFKRPKVKS
jgi:hypothetical protein